MKQFFTILKFELKNYLTNKIFVGITVFLAVAIAVVMFFPRFIGDSDSTDGAPVADGVMLISCEEPSLAEPIRTAFAASFADYEVRLAEGGEEAVRSAVDKGEADCGFALHSLTSYT